MTHKPQYEISQSFYSGKEADFEPLKAILPDNIEEYMFMGKHRCYSLTNTVMVYSYKHVTNREYLNVSASGRFFVSVDSRTSRLPAFEPIGLSEGIKCIIKNAIDFHKESVMLAKYTNQ
jgi:hypothetical protein